MGPGRRVAAVSLLLVLAAGLQVSALVDDGNTTDTSINETLENGTSTVNDTSLNGTDENVTAAADCTAGTNGTDCEAGSDPGGDGAASGTNASADDEGLCGIALNSTCDAAESADPNASAEANASADLECSVSSSPPGCAGGVETDPSPELQEQRSVTVAGMEVTVEVDLSCSLDLDPSPAPCDAQVAVAPDLVQWLLDTVKGLDAGGLQLL